ncbi:MAG: HAD-IIIC family phosphatase [Clostridia bacterium]|nr:HAD-IIIC family phosphatase [Clostridia bacterium]
MKSVDLKNTKLIIWDLDNTFWKGTISEEGIEIIPSNISLVKALSKKGIINSICSKNDFSVCENKLKELGVWEYFVFPSINWEPKGVRIKNMIENMGLRPVNVVFIDDSENNLNEAEFYSPEITTCLPSEIENITAQASETADSDEGMTRLEKYKILEKKFQEKESFSSNEEFLYSSAIKLEIVENWESEFERIHELIMRTNRLNFTKNRASKEELKTILEDKNTRSGYVQVSDRYGDYGIVGFFAIKDARAEHFLFSCRTMGMGIEQYVYSELGFPEIEIVGEVSGTLEKNVTPEWINQEGSGNKQTKKNSNNVKILFKGPCDLSGITTYLEDDSMIDDEFNYINEETGVFIKSRNHTLHILQNDLPQDRKDEIVSELPFGDKDMYSTSMFDGEYNIVFFSTFTDPLLGVYKRKTGETVAYGDWCYDLTSDENRGGYISGELNTSNCKFTDEIIDKFKAQYTYCGRLSADEIVENLKEIRAKLSSETVLVLMLGSEKECLANTQKAYDNRHEFNKELNSKIKEAFKDYDNVDYVCFNDFVTGQEDYLDSITHFVKVVYYRASQRVIEIIEKYSGKSVKRRSKLFLFATKVLQKSSKNKVLYSLMLKLRRIIKKFI